MSIGIKDFNYKGKITVLLIEKSEILWGKSPCKMLPNKIENEVSFLPWKLSLNANVINKHGLLYTWQCTFCIDVT